MADCMYFLFSTIERMGERHTNAVKHKEHAILTRRGLKTCAHVLHPLGFCSLLYERLLAIYIVTSVILRFRDYLNVV